MKLFLAAMTVCALGMFALAARADDKDMKDMHDMTGVLIDNHCGADKSEADAAKHPISCCKKPACEASGYQLVVGDKHYKLDDKGNDQAKAYLANATATQVTISGKMEGEDKIDVSAIKAAEEKK